MKPSNVISRLGAGLGKAKWSRLAVILALSLLTGLSVDYLRNDRVFFPRPLPAIVVVPNR